MKRNGFAPIILLIVIGVVLIGGGAWYYKNVNVSRTPITQSLPEQSHSQNVVSPLPTSSVLTITSSTSVSPLSGEQLTAEQFISKKLATVLAPSSTNAAIYNDNFIGPYGRHVVTLVGPETLDALAQGFLKIPGATYALVDGKESSHYDGLGHKAYFSANGRHYAYVAKRDQKVFVVLDGIEGQPFVRIDEGFGRELNFNADGSKFVYIGYRYNASDKSAHYFLVVNNEGTEITNYGRPTSPQISPSGSMISFVASKGKEQIFMVINNQPSPAYDGVLGGMVWSKDEKTMAYVVWRGKSVFAVVNGKELYSKDYSSLAGDSVNIAATDLAINSDGTQIAYRVSLYGGASWTYVPGQDTQALILNGQEITSPSSGKQITNISFNPVNDKFLYTYKDSSKKCPCVVYDRKTTQLSGSDVAKVVFSPDGQHIAFVESNSGIVVDGVISSILKSLPFTSSDIERIVSMPIFTLDSKYIMYGANIEKDRKYGAPSELWWIVSPIQ